MSRTHFYVVGWGNREVKNHQYCYATAFGASESNIFGEAASSGVEHNASDRSYDVLLGLSHW